MFLKIGRPFVFLAQTKKAASVGGPFFCVRQSYSALAAALIFLAKRDLRRAALFL